MRIGLLVLTGALALSSPAFAQRRPAPFRPHFTFDSPSAEKYVPGQLLVKYLQSRAANLELQARQTTRGMAVPVAAPIAGARFMHRLGKSGWTLWSIPAVARPEYMAAAAAKSPGVLYAEPVHPLRLLLDTPNDADFNYIEDDPNLVLNISGEGPDPTFRRLWHLDDINAFGGWSIWPNQWYDAISNPKPANSPLVAVVDSGCDLSHPDFINANGTSTDVSGGGQLELGLSQQFHFSDIVVGGDPNDTNGHGTHVTGLIMAAGNNGGFNGDGVIGIGYNARGMICRVIDSTGSGTDGDGAAAIMYAADNGADIISLSIGDNLGYSQVFQDAVRYAYQKGCLVVCAGNENGTTGGGDIGPIYPADCSGALAVTANGPGQAPATTDYAGSGPYICIAAPGGDVVLASDLSSEVIQYVFSTAMEVPGDLYAATQASGIPPFYTLDYAYLAGTSMATPQVSGAAALYYGEFGLHQTDGWSNVRAFRALEASADDVMGASDGGWEPVQGYGCLDVQTLMQDAIRPEAQIGGIAGQVLYNGTPLADVAVTATHTVNGHKTTFSTTTREHGMYRFDGMPPGIYSVHAAPFGAPKTKLAIVKVGSDLAGTDFFCGNFQVDDTPPVLAKFQVQSVSPSTVVFQHFAYDTETGLDSIVATIGTTSGGSDVMAATQIVVDTNVATLSGLSLPANTDLYLTVVYTNGNGLTTTAQAQIEKAQLSGSVTLQDFLGSVSSQTVHVDIRTPGTATAVESYDVPLDSSGAFHVSTGLTGTYDIAMRGAHWLRQRLSNVVIGGTGVSGLKFSLINGDVNGDNRVDLGDASVLAKAYGSHLGSTNWNPAADLNGDGRVDLGDVGIVRKNFRKSGNP